jgi:hypothetical protein
MRMSRRSSSVRRTEPASSKSDNSLATWTGDRTHETVSQPLDGPGSDGADGTPLTGWGWAKLEDGHLHGMIVIHMGDESGFVTKRAPKRTRLRRK